MPNPLTFGKEQKLCGQLRINNLYAQGKHFVCYPLRVTCMKVSGAAANQILVWAPKKLIKRAVKRNRLRRLMREAYRLNAGPLETWSVENNCRFQVAFNYLAPDELPYHVVEKAMKKALSKITEV